MKVAIAIREKRSNAQLSQKEHPVVGWHGDIDNYVKFVLDAMSGVVYRDDRTVALLQVVRLYDNDQGCGGATDVSVSVVTNDDIQSAYSSIIYSTSSYI